ncbi:hypothetical protein [Corynebacterium pygosceleis]|uniref:FCS-type domain-containing protein n=1 Tax=Corynebacterium pygosceleis TaxID=2800406 RepID=A0A9Q4C7P5_9CORY|nr:hypothetical protein [Corynebacterium pygosceleis]MCK7637083.1 hypothetical protein [Corynebacterium pygosceleis]MCK7674557.1 hypothetical protein [Corynebacterium pygosceleis]MCL0120144.1 hypothetical protein [Corynebacterium pygosceleis]MCX7443689.1 hypothetical protein [Corynebacterium pygosceleis]MCX7467836.1 hypothetical protein [Corynebacterium pygosceleis]
MDTRRQATCRWCQSPVPEQGRGRPRKYCSHSCRQRAYEQRNRVSGTSIPADAVIMRPEKAEQLTDLLFELRCAAEDIATAAEEDSPPAEIRDLCTELVTLARRAEHLR